MDQTTVTTIARVPDPTGSHRYFAISSVLPMIARDFNCVSQDFVQKLNQYGVYPQITPDPVAFLEPNGNLIPSGGTIALDISLAGVVATLSFDIYPGPYPNAMIIGMPGLRVFNANFDAASKVLTVGIAPVSGLLSRHIRLPAYLIATGWFDPSSTLYREA